MVEWRLLYVFLPVWLWSMHAPNLGLRNLVVIIVVLVSYVACFLTNLILYWILLWSKFHTSLAWLVFYHMAGSVSNQDDQRQLLCSDSATQILLRARIVTTRKKLFFQQYWYNYNYLLTARLVQSRTCFVFVCKNVEKNLPDIQRSHWSKLYMYWNYSVLYTNMWPPKQKKFDQWLISHFCQSSHS